VEVGPGEEMLGEVCPMEAAAVDVDPTEETVEE